MQNCRFCGSQLPDNASFCGYCGGIINDPVQGAMDVTSPSTGSDLPLDTPPLASEPSHSMDGDGEAGQQDTDVTIRQRWSEGELVQNIQEPEESQGDEGQAVLPDVLLSGMLPGEGQAPPSGPEIARGAETSASPSWEPQMQTPPAHHSPQPLWRHPTSPHQHPQPTPAAPAHYFPQPLWRHPAAPRQHPQLEPPAPEHYEPHLQYHHPPAVVQPAYRRHMLRLLTTPSKLVAGTMMKWIIVVVTATVVIATSGIIVVLATPPVLSLNGRSTISAGGTLLLHGKGFFPGGSVTFTLDNGLPVSSINHSLARAVAYSVDRGGSSANALQMLLAEQSGLQTSSNASVSVSTIGTFDASIKVSTNWSPGLHTIHATESFGSRAADLSFTIVAAPKLLVQQKNLVATANNCLTITGSGNLIRGWLCTVTLNTDSGDLSWSATSTNSSDRFTPSKEVVHPNQPESVSIFITNEPRCSNATFTFVGPTNSVFVSWSCPTH
jgi:hypothetical protein